MTDGVLDELREKVRCVNTDEEVREIHQMIDGMNPRRYTIPSDMTTGDDDTDEYLEAVVEVGEVTGITRDIHVDEPYVTIDISLRALGWEVDDYRQDNFSP